MGTFISNVLLSMIVSTEYKPLNPMFGVAAVLFELLTLLILTILPDFNL